MAKAAKKAESKEAVKVVTEKELQKSGEPVAPAEEVVVENPKNQAGVESAPKGSYVIAQEFHDIVDFSIVYKIGEAAKFEGKRLQELIEQGLVKEK